MPAMEHPPDLLTPPEAELDDLELLELRCPLLDLELELVLPLLELEPLELRCPLLDLKLELAFPLLELELLVELVCPLLELELLDVDPAHGTPPSYGVGSSRVVVAGTVGRQPIRHVDGFRRQLWTTFITGPQRRGKTIAVGSRRNAFVHKARPRVAHRARGQAIDRAAINLLPKQGLIRAGRYRISSHANLYGILSHSNLVEGPLGAVREGHAREGAGGE